MNVFDNNGETRATVLAVAGDRTHALTSEGHDASEDGTGRGTPIVAFSHTQGMDAQPSEDAWPTLRSQGGGHGDAVPTTGVRRLTPKEAERLQGFPDGHTAHRTAPDGTVVAQADSSRYRQLGNAVAVPVVEWIMRRIVEEDAP